MLPRIEAQAVGDEQPVPAGGGALRVGQRPAQHRPAVVEESAFGFEAFAPAVLTCLAHDGAAEGGEVGRKTALQGEALPVVPRPAAGSGKRLRTGGAGHDC